jgi:hypothetical protein
MQPDPIQTASRARQLWQINGSPSGRDTEFWLQAESELRKELAQVEEQAGTSTPPKVKKPVQSSRKTKSARP